MISPDLPRPQVLSLLESMVVLSLAFHESERLLPTELDPATWTQCMRLNKRLAAAARSALPHAVSRRLPSVRPAPASSSTESASSADGMMGSEVPALLRKLTALQQQTSQQAAGPPVHPAALGRKRALTRPPSTLAGPPNIVNGEAATAHALRPTPAQLGTSDGAPAAAQATREATATEPPTRAARAAASASDDAPSVSFAAGPAVQAGTAVLESAHAAPAAAPAAAPPPVPSVQDVHSRLIFFENLFLRLDVDGSSSIDFDEMRRLFSFTATKMSSAEVEQALRSVDDEQADGSLSRFEFMNLCVRYLFQV